MPGATDGLALLNYIRANLNDLPVVVVSGHLDASAAVAAGAVDYLSKPFTRTKFLEVIERHARRA
jgi:two-component system nitrogen regulation response regulator GlnG